jgi:hypothetical protein
VQAAAAGGYKYGDAAGAPVADHSSHFGGPGDAAPSPAPAEAAEEVDPAAALAAASFDAHSDVEIEKSNVLILGPTGQLKRWQTPPL